MKSAREERSGDGDESRSGDQLAADCVQQPYQPADLDVRPYSKLAGADGVGGTTYRQTRGEHGHPDRRVDIGGDRLDRTVVADVGDTGDDQAVFGCKGFEVFGVARDRDHA